MAKKAAFAVIEYGDTPVVVNDLSQYQQPSEAEEIDVTVFGTGRAEFIPGPVRDRFECSGFLNYSDPGQLAMINARGSETAVLVGLFPEGKGSGLLQITGNAYVMAVTPGGEANGAIQVDFVLQFDGNGATYAVQA